MASYSNYNPYSTTSYGSSGPANGGGFYSGGGGGGATAGLDDSAGGGGFGSPGSASRVGVHIIASHSISIIFPLSPLIHFIIPCKQKLI